MKTTVLTALTLTALMVSSQAINLTLSNNFSVGFVDNSGTAIPVGTGFAAAGTISDVDSLSVDTIGSSFSPIGANGGSFIPFANAANADGFTGGSIQGGRADSMSMFVNQPIFVVLGNGTNLSDSDQFAVFATGETFTADSGTPLESNITFQPGDNDTLLLGETGPTIPLNALTRPSIQLVGGEVIPEPSTGLLALLGLAGVLRRRR